MQIKTILRRWLGRAAAGVAGAVLAGSILAATDTTTYFHNDVSGTPQLATNAAGQVVWKESYRPYGEKLTNAPASANNDIGFAGKPFDNNTGLSYMGARYYDPVLGRFTGIDPKEVDSQDLHSFNRYAYGNNNPYKFVDPDGRSPLDVGFLVFDLGNLAHALYNGNGVGEAAIGVGLSVVGVISPVPGTGVALKAARAAEVAEYAVQARRVANEVGHIAQEAGSVAKTGTYEFKMGDQIYVGQSSNIPQRLQQHIKSGKLAPDAVSTVKTTEVQGGKTAREIAEHKRIQEITGGVPARFSDKVANKVDPIGPNRQHLLNE